MIDDLTVVMSTGHLGRIKVVVPHREKLMTCPDGTVRTWLLIKARGGTIQYQPDTQLMCLKLSFPRLAYSPGSSWTYNFPLCPAPWKLDLAAVSGEILDKLGVHRRPRENPVKKLGLIEAAVRHVAYAFDAETESGEQTLVAVTSLRRRYARQAQTYNRPGRPPHAFEFEGTDRRLMLYRKDEEIRARIRPLRGRHTDYGRPLKEVRDQLAEHARDVVRVELTLKNPQAVRAVWGLAAGRLPKLGFVLREDVGSFLLRRELVELGLPVGYIDAEADAANVEQANGDVVVGMLMAIVEAVAAHRRAGGTGSRGNVIKGLRVLLMVIYSLLQNRISDEKLRELLDVSDNTLRYMRADLEAIGMPAGVSPDHQKLLRHLVDEFEHQFLDAPDTLPSLGDADVVDAPWADRVGDDKYDEETEGFVFDDDPVAATSTEEVRGDSQSVDRRFGIELYEAEDDFDHLGDEHRDATPPPKPRRPEPRGPYQPSETDHLMLRQLARIRARSPTGIWHIRMGRKTCELYERVCREARLTGPSWSRAFDGVPVNCVLAGDYLAVHFEGAPPIVLRGDPAARPPLQPWRPP